MYLPLSKMAQYVTDTDEGTGDEALKRSLQGHPTYSKLQWCLAKVFSYNIPIHLNFWVLPTWDLHSDFYMEGL